MVLSVLIGITQFYILVSYTVITKENKHCFVKHKDIKLSFNHNQCLLTLYVSVKFTVIQFFSIFTNVVIKVEHIIILEIAKSDILSLFTDLNVPGLTEE